jgi:hypothetical protein
MKITYQVLNIYTKPVTHISNNKEIKTNRKNTIKHTTGNEYNTNLPEKPLSQPQKQNIHEGPKYHKIKWATFTYCEKEVRQPSFLETRNLE